MSFRSDLQSAAAMAALDVCRALGETISYSNRGATAVTLYAAPDEEVKETAEVLGAMAEESTRSFFIPLQTSFPPDNGISINDEISYPTDATYTYRITSFKADATGAGYDVKTVRSQITKLGKVK